MQLNDTKTLLKSIYSHIHPDNGILEQLDDEVFDLVDGLLAQLAYDGLIDEIYLNSDEPDLRKIGRLFDILMWQTEDNGSYLFKQVATWIRGQDKLKIEIALSVEDTFPLYPTSDFEKEIKRIEVNFPELKARCDYWLAAVEKHKQIRY